MPVFAQDTEALLEEEIAFALIVVFFALFRDRPPERQLRRHVHAKQIRRRERRIRRTGCVVTVMVAAIFLRNAQNRSYCFAAQGKFHGEAGLMSFETGKRALDFLIEHSGTRRNLEVDFFGGEPLMNFEVCKQLVAYARSIEKEHNKNFRFTMTTNGIGITDEVIDWCNKECHNVVLSLDGRKEVNDRFRVDLAGNGSYDRIVQKS